MPADCTIATHVADLPDPRIDRCKRHELLAIVTIARCGVICGADSWVEIEFGIVPEQVPRLHRDAVTLIA